MRMSIARTEVGVQSRLVWSSFLQRATRHATTSERREKTDRGIEFDSL